MGRIIEWIARRAASGMLRGMVSMAMTNEMLCEYLLIHVSCLCEYGIPALVRFPHLFLAQILRYSRS